MKTQLVSHKIVPAKVTGGTNWMYVAADGSAKTEEDVRDKKGRMTERDVTAGREKVQTPWGERTRRVDPAFRTGG